MEQKFFRGQRIKLAKKFPESMSHFSGKGCEAIVYGSYSDLCHGHGDYSNFELLIIPKGSKSIKDYYLSAWYYEDQMTLISNNRNAGERLLQEYAEWFNDHPDGDLTDKEIASREKEL